MRLTNNGSDLYALTFCIIFRKLLVLARLPGIFANSNENHRCYNFQAFANIFGTFRKIVGKFTNLTMSL